VLFLVAVFVVFMFVMPGLYQDQLTEKIMSLYLFFLLTKIGICNSNGSKEVDVFVESIKDG